MRAIKNLVPLILVGGTVLLTACQSVSIDPSGGGVPPAGVIRGTVNYIGPPPCSQNGHVVGNVIILVFDAHNPPPPAGLGTTAVNFGVVPGDALFRDWPVTPGSTKICPDANYPTQTVSAPYAISPMNPGRYLIQSFFDYTGNFFATFKFRQLPEATDIGGGYIDVNDATKLVPDQTQPEPLADGGTTFPLHPQQADPNYLPHFLPVNIGTAGPTPSTSLWGVPSFTMPDTGYLADNVTVTVAEKLPFSRPYFYPKGIQQQQPTNGATFGYGDSSDVRPPTTPKVITGQNPNGNVDFISVLSFPQDTQIFAQPSVNAVGKLGTGIIDEFQGALPEIWLQAGVAPPEEAQAADTLNPADPFHMQLGIPNAPSNYAPGGNGRIFVWQDGTHTDDECGGMTGCSLLLNSVPENPAVFRMWPLVVLAKLDDLPVTTPATAQPNPNDPQSLIAQGTDLAQPIVIIQGITLFEDSLAHTTQLNGLAGSIAPPLVYPDFAGGTNLKDHVAVLVRPSTLCLDPRAPDNGGVLVTTGTVGANGQVLGQFPPDDTYDKMINTPIVIDSQILSNPQLSKLINHNLAGAHNGLMGGCLPTGRYQINMVYPTGQAWTTPNETGSCAAGEGSTLLSTNPGNCSGKPRPVLRSQGTRAVVEITPQTDMACAVIPSPPQSSFPANTVFNPKTKLPYGYDTNVPFVCQALCPDPSLDPTAPTPCSVCLDKTLNPATSPPCTTHR